MIDSEKEKMMVQIIDRHVLHNALPDAGASLQFEGLDFGPIPLSFFWTDAPAGTGPQLHQHPYAEVFVVEEGPVIFTVAGETFAATGGQIVIAPPDQPHRYVNAGPGQPRHVDIHPTGRMNTAPIDTGAQIATTCVIDRHELPHSERAHQFEGQDYGALPLSFFWTDAPPGSGPGLHRHPYAEVFVVQEGAVSFTVGGAMLDATAGQIVIVPAGEWHRLVNRGPGRTRHLDLHPSGQICTEWLDE
jgi:mannose-6-phosphate isomerase-like protein (cupin superfamily)